MSPEQAMERLNLVLAHAWMVRTFLKHAEEILARLGLKPGDAFNMLLAQIELREAVPFTLSTRDNSVLAVQEQAAEWTKAFGEY